MANSALIDKTQAELVRRAVNIDWSNPEQVRAFEQGYRTAWTKLDGNRATLAANLKKITGKS